MPTRRLFDGAHAGHLLPAWCLRPVYRRQWRRQDDLWIPSPPAWSGDSNQRQHLPNGRPAPVPVLEPSRAIALVPQDYAHPTRCRPVAENLDFFSGASGPGATRNGRAQIAAAIALSPALEQAGLPAEQPSGGGRRRRPNSGYRPLGSATGSCSSTSPPRLASTRTAPLPSL